MKGKERPIQQAERISGQTALELGYELVETRFDKEPTGTYLRIFVDRPGGISLTDCETFHRAVQPRLEAVEYDFLEVSSPGIDRPIKNEKDARKAIGSRVEVRLYRPAGGRKEFSGILTGFEEEGFRIRTEGGEMVFPQADVALLRREIDMSVLDEPGMNEREEEE